MSTNSLIIEKVDAFTCLLKQHNVLEDYINLYAEYHNLEHAPVPVLHWYAWATQTNPKAWISEAFLWTKDSDNPDRWYDIHIAWIHRLCES